MLPLCMMSCRNLFGTAFLSQLSIHGDHGPRGETGSLLSTGIAEGWPPNRLQKRTWLCNGDDADNVGLDFLALGFNGICCP